MPSLTEKICLPCEGGIPALKKHEAENLLKEVPNWQLDMQSKTISRQFQFKNFYETMSFVNAVAWVANRENHHPDMEVCYNTCNIHFQTHAIHGLSENDFICAAKIDRLMENLSDS